jgi:hypothetical protein
VDYQVLKFSAANILSVSNESEAFFIYYMFATAASLAEPFLQFAVDFYEKYCLTHVRGADEHLATTGLLVNVLRLVMQLLLSLWVSYKFSMPLFFVISGLDNLSQIKKTLDSYSRIRSLSGTMQHLKRV